MKPVFNEYLMLKPIADNSLKKQVVHPKDYINADGLLVCHVCGALKQEYMTPRNPCEADPDRRTTLKMAVECRCPEIAEARRRKQKEARVAMERMKDLRESSLMEDKFKKATFDQYKITQHNEKNFKRCKRYATKFDEMVEKNQGIVMWGDVSTGKSHTAACIANYLLSKGVPVIMTSFVKILENIRDNKETVGGFIRKMKYAQLVIFDDLGTERVTPYGAEVIFNIVDSRVRQELPIIVTTNLTIQEMKEETDVRYKRVYERLFETCYPMQFTGPSWRRSEANRRFTEMENFFDED